MAAVVDPKTGKVLAMGQRPSFNPNVRDVTNYYNDLVSYSFEPGSTMKIFTLAAAIQEGVYNGGEQYKSGSYSVSKKISRLKTIMAATAGARSHLMKVLNAPQTSRLRSLPMINSAQTASINICGSSIFTTKRASTCLEKRTAKSILNICVIKYQLPLVKVQRSRRSSSFRPRQRSRITEK